MHICKIPASAEWMSPASLDYIRECLEYCKNPEMLQELREIFPREALTAASRYVEPPQRSRLQQWLTEINRQAVV